MNEVQRNRLRQQRITNREALEFCRVRLNCPSFWKKLAVAEAARDAMGLTGPVNVYKVLQTFFLRYQGIDGIAKQIDETGICPIKPAPKPPQKLQKPKGQEWFRVCDIAESVISHEQANSDAFLQSYEWRRLRMEVIKARGARCECCGASPKDGIRIHVDHIKPRRRYPELALTRANLQVLCEVCNHGKGSWDETDWRAVRADVGGEMDTPVPQSGESYGQQKTPVVNSLRARLKKRATDDGVSSTRT